MIRRLSALLIAFFILAVVLSPLVDLESAVCHRQHHGLHFGLDAVSGPMNSSLITSADSGAVKQVPMPFLQASPLVSLRC